VAEVGEVGFVRLLAFSFCFRFQFGFSWFSLLAVFVSFTTRVWVIVSSALCGSVKNSL
jgi:hypothetical protein